MEQLELTDGDSKNLGLLIGNLPLCNPNVGHEIGFVMGQAKSQRKDVANTLADGALSARRQASPPSRLLSRAWLRLVSLLWITAIRPNSRSAAVGYPPSATGCDALKSDFRPLARTPWPHCKQHSAECDTSKTLRQESRLVVIGPHVFRSVQNFADLVSEACGGE